MINFTYDIYCEVGSGLLDEDDFNIYSRRAVNHLRRLTSYQVDSVTESGDAYHDVCCCLSEMTDMVYRDTKGISDIASESNDGISVSYRGTDGRSRDRRLYDCAAAYLQPYGLLYRGI